MLRKYLEEWIRNILVMNDEQENYGLTLKLLGIYQNILKAFNLYKKIFQVLVSNVPDNCSFL